MGGMHQIALAGLILAECGRTFSEAHGYMVPDLLLTRARARQLGTGYCMQMGMCCVVAWWWCGCGYDRSGVALGYACNRRQEKSGECLQWIYCIHTNSHTHNQHLTPTTHTLPRHHQKSYFPFLCSSLSLIDKNNTLHKHTNTLTYCI